ncbi:RING/U-box superfamily protein [Forsythia ovata]|uniref:RBR-type E3 ubiquitin transferase n=1 Tax=Forsythia ovata TaxID=205694 RepID=A0ABD1PXW6_9LAMI
MTLSELIRRYFQARTKTGYSRQFQDEQEDQNLENPEDEICEICIEPMILRERKFKNRDKCSHPFCIDCIINYIQVKLEYENVDKIKCPGLNCNQLLDPISCRSVIGLSLFVKWCDLLCEKAILGVGKSYCPYRNCNVLILNECGGTLKKSQCPNCKNWFCFQCKRIWHAGFGCKESRKWSDRDDIAFGKLVEQYKWTRCPLCRHFVERIEGCRNVKCRKRGHMRVRE